METLGEWIETGRKLAEAEHLRDNERSFLRLVLDSWDRAEGECRSERGLPWEPDPERPD